LKHSLPVEVNDENHRSIETIADWGETELSNFASLSGSNGERVPENAGLSPGRHPRVKRDHGSVAHRSPRFTAIDIVGFASDERLVLRASIGLSCS